MKPGIYNDLSNEDYHAGPGLSSSGIKKFLKSPAHFKAETKQTPAMAFGSAFHAMVLEPDLFDKEYRVCPGVVSKASAKWKAFCAENEGLNILTPDEFKLLTEMRVEVESHPSAIGAITQATHIEQSVFWEDPGTGVLCKVRTDIRIEPLKIIADLKSTLDASPDSFSKAIYNYGYHISAAWYLRGINAALKTDEYKRFLFIAVEKAPPFGVAVYEADEDMIRIGNMKIEEMLPAYAKCLKEDRWPGYDTSVTKISLPRWAK